MSAPGIQQTSRASIVVFMLTKALSEPKKVVLQQLPRTKMDSEKVTSVDSQSQEERIVARRARISQRIEAAQK